MARITLYPIPVLENFADGMTQPSVVVNTNARRAEVCALPARAFESTEPVSPAQGDLVVMSAAWLTGEEGDLAYYYDDTWLFFIPYEGMEKLIGGVESICVFDSSGANWPTLMSTLGDFPDDAAAAATVPIGGRYRNGSVKMGRIA